MMKKNFFLIIFNELPDLLSMVFLKGYQWPFDVNKIFWRLFGDRPIGLPGDCIKKTQSIFGLQGQSRKP